MSSPQPPAARAFGLATFAGLAATAFFAGAAFAALAGAFLAGVLAMMLRRASRQRRSRPRPPAPLAQHAAHLLVRKSATKRLRSGKVWWAE